MISLIIKSLCFTSGLRTGFARDNTVEYELDAWLDKSYKIGLLRQVYSMSSHAEIIRSDALNSLLFNEKVSGLAKIEYWDSLI